MSNDLIAFTENQLDLIKNQIAKGCTDLELQYFIAVCKRTGLDPISNQIFAIKRNQKQKDGSYKSVMTIQTGIDGYRAVAHRTGRCGGIEDAKFVMKKNPTNGAEINVPHSATVTVYKIVDGQKASFTATAFYDEYYGESDYMAKKRPFGMLAKSAEALALRKAFPVELSAVYTPDEMEMADKEDNEIIREKKLIEDTKDKDYIKTEEQLAVIEKLGAELTKGMTPQVKMKYICDLMAIKTWEDLKRKTNLELDHIIGVMDKLMLDKKGESDGKTKG